MVSHLRSCLFLLLCSICIGASAGQTCEEKPATPESLQKAFALALKTRETLENSGATVALVARVGQDLSKYRLRYSHIGFAWRDHPQGKWLLVHLLNDCGTAASGLYNQGLANYFADDMFAWEALVVFPSDQTQEGLVRRLASGAATYLHEPRYNMLAYPFSPQYQNSNQWILETLAEVYADTTFVSRTASTDWLRKNHFHPTRLEIPTLTRLGARMFRANVAFDDHPMDQRMAGRIETTTVDSVIAFIEQQEGKIPRQIVRLPQANK